ncbi:MAG: LLM class F420-dependent oxidoreductase [Chloroflexi bacterium]|nr:LLM class F420-dependent oxidoreductase [Chloroflexota bacterium]
MPPRFGIQQPSFSFPGGPELTYQTVERICLEAEGLGFDSFWLMDHFIQIPQVGAEKDRILEPWVTLSALAARTQRIRLGPLCLGNTYRNPALVAKMGATLDVVSNGRLFLGLGGGWHQREHEAYGFPFYTRGERLRRLEEAVQIIKAMWVQGSATFQGRYYQARDALCYPLPVQRPHPPILVGGGGEELTLRIVARHAQACNLFGEPETVRHKLDVLTRHCRDVGRDPASILKTRLGVMVIAATEKELKQKLDTYYPGIPPASFQGRVTAGTPGQVAEGMQGPPECGAGLPYLQLS